MLLMNLESRPVIFEDVARQVNLKMAHFTKYFYRFIEGIANYVIFIDRKGVIE